MHPVKLVSRSWKQLWNIFETSQLLEIQHQVLDDIEVVPCQMSFFEAPPFALKWHPYLCQYLDSRTVGGSRIYISIKATMNNTTDLYCPSDYPSALDFYNSFGGYAIALYVCSSVVVAVLLVQFLFLVRHFIKHVPGSRRVATLWVNSVYLVVAVATLFCVALPQATDFVWLFYRVYLGMAMGYFVDLTMAWYGGESDMLANVGHGRLINMRVRPCCLCVGICSKQAVFSKRKIQILRGSVYQMPYIQSVAIFLLVVFELTDYLSIGDLNPRQPYLYLMVIILASFFLGLWALFVFFDITNRFDLLHDFKYGQKAGLLKAIVILVNIQGFIIDSLAKYNLIGCTNVISPATMGSVIKSILCLVESFVLGTLAFKLYITDDTHL